MEKGIWAVLYICLFFRMLRENKERKGQHQSIIGRLSSTIKEEAPPYSGPVE